MKDKTCEFITTALFEEESGGPGEMVSIYASVYQNNGAPALFGLTEDGQRFATFTVNAEIALTSGEVVIKDYSEGALFDYVGHLVAAGVVSAPHRFVSFGYVLAAPVCRLTEASYAQYRIVRRYFDSQN